MDRTETQTDQTCESGKEAILAAAARCFMTSGFSDTSIDDVADSLGATKGRIDMQSEFVGNLMNAIERGVGTLVDADMTKESTRLSALQTQQQLGTQALSIANSSSQSILSLFR